MAAPKSQITPEMIDQASKIADVRISDESRSMMLDSLNDFIKDYDLIYALKIPIRSLQPSYWIRFLWE